MRLATRMAMAFFAVAATAGCAYRDFDRPLATTAVFRKFDSGEPYVENKGEEERERTRAEQLARALAEWRSQGGGKVADEYHLGVADVVDVAVLSLDTPGTPSVLSRKISADGTVNLPWVGDLKLVGLLPREAEKQVVACYGGGYIKNPRVTVTVAAYNSAAIIMTGAVRKPGVYHLKRDKMTILEMLSEVDGLTAAAGPELLIVRGGGEGGSSTGLVAGVQEGPSDGTTQSDPAVVEGTSQGGWEDLLTAAPTNAVVNKPAATADTNGVAVATASKGNILSVDLDLLLEQGDQRLNLFLKAGDVVVVPPRRPEYVYVLGYVNRPSAYPIDTKNRIGAVEVVAMAGGLGSGARAENSFIVRKAGEGAQEVIPVDLTKIVQGMRPPVYMEAGDTLVVGSSLMMRLSDFIRVGADAGVSMRPSIIP